MTQINPEQISTWIDLPGEKRLCVLEAPSEFEGCVQKFQNVMGLSQNAMVIDNCFNLKWVVKVKPKRKLSSWITDVRVVGGLYYLFDFNENKYKLSKDFKLAKYDGSANCWE